jgi:hypothetical protein
MPFQRQSAACTGTSGASFQKAPFQIFSMPNRVRMLATIEAPTSQYSRSCRPTTTIRYLP